MRRPLLVVLGLAVATAASGCSSGTAGRSTAATATASATDTPSASPSASATPTPSAAAPATHVPSPPSGPARETPPPLPSPVTASGAAGLPLCTVGQLAAVLASVSAGSAGDQAGFVELRNSSASPCRLQGRPAVQMLSGSGAPLRTVPLDATLYREAPVAMPAGTPPLRPGALVEGHAYLAVVFNPVHDTGGAMCSPPEVTTPAKLSVAVPGGNLTVDATAADGSGKQVQACHGQLRVSVFASRGTAATQ